MGQYFSWIIYNPKQDIIYEAERNLEIDKSVNLCIWQGFAFSKDMTLGEYRLVISSDEQEIYQQTFQLVK